MLLALGKNPDDVQQEILNHMTQDFVRGFQTIGLELLLSLSYFSHACNRQELQREDEIISTLIPRGEQQVRNSPPRANAENEQKLHYGSNELHVARTRRKRGKSEDKNYITERG